MSCKRAQDLVLFVIDTAVKMVDFTIGILDVIRIHKTLKARNDALCLDVNQIPIIPECNFNFNLSFDILMFDKMLKDACQRARRTVNELRICRLKKPDEIITPKPGLKAKCIMLGKKIAELANEIENEKTIERLNLREFKEIIYMFNQLEIDVKLLTCNLGYATKMKDTVLFAAPVTDIMGVLSTILIKLQCMSKKVAEEASEQILPKECEENDMFDFEGSFETFKESLIPRDSAIEKSSADDEALKRMDAKRLSELRMQYNIKTSKESTITDAELLEYIKQENLLRAAKQKGSKTASIEETDTNAHSYKSSERKFARKKEHPSKTAIKNIEQLKRSDSVNEKNQRILMFYGDDIASSVDHKPKYHKKNKIFPEIEKQHTQYSLPDKKIRLDQRFSGGKKYSTDNSLTSISSTVSDDTENDLSTFQSQMTDSTNCAVEKNAKNRNMAPPKHNRRNKTGIERVKSFTTSSSSFQERNTYTDPIKLEFVDSPPVIFRMRKQDLQLFEKSNNIHENKERLNDELEKITNEIKNELSGELGNLRHSEEIERHIRMWKDY